MKLQGACPRRGSGQGMNSNRPNREPQATIGNKRTRTRATSTDATAPAASSAPAAAATRDRTRASCSPFRPSMRIRTTDGVTAFVVASKR
jgi:hypothetical protein